MTRTLPQISGAIRDHAEKLITHHADDPHSWRYQRIAELLDELDQRILEQHLEMSKLQVELAAANKLIHELGEVIG